MTARSLVRRPHAATASLTASQVAHAYNYPTGVTGKGVTVGLVELGGGYRPSDFPHLNLTAVAVDGGKNALDGVNGADGEVQLDIEVASSVAPGAAFRVYFAPNTDAGFLAAIKQAAAECNVVSISWGGPETSWSAASLDQFDAALAAARAAGVIVLVAAGDSGSDDGTSTPTVDFPASSPNVIACGGTRLTVDANGQRSTETTWDDDDTTSATGGGVSRHFPGRQVPDVAGNADPTTGYQVTIDGQRAVIGGTSAVAPLYAGLVALLSEAIGEPLGKRTDFLNLLATNLGVFFDVTAGDNGAYRAGPGRDNVTGWGVVDGGKLLAVLKDQVADPAPVPPTGGTPAPPSG
ncbi:S8 family serine peptidase, partial [uncultured Jatrophihabitans sp.]|uniref:S53 family peptidase n=1 Tax=uncultured Jatrophihabitans sp. TaxID=1610747 RepID=UPI0035CAE76A